MKLLLLSGCEHIYWILGLEVEVHSIWVLWITKTSRMQGNFFGGKSVGVGKVFDQVRNFFSPSCPGLDPISRPLLQKARWGCFSVHR